VAELAFPSGCGLAAAGVLLAMRCGRVVGVVLAGAGLRRAGVPRLRCWVRACGAVAGGCLARGFGALRAPRGAAGSRGCGGLPLSAFPCRTGSVNGFC
jgi:hypothetical protein